MAFPKQNTWILVSFDLKSVLTRQTSDKVADKPGLDYLLECSLPSYFARIIIVLPEKFQNLLKLGGLSTPSPQPPGPYAYDFKKYLESGATTKVTYIYSFM